MHGGRRGGLLITLVSGKQTAGSNKVEWDGSGFSSGVYFYRMSANAKTQNFMQTKELILLK